MTEEPTGSNFPLPSESGGSPDGTPSANQSVSLESEEPQGSLPPSEDAPAPQAGVAPSGQPWDSLPKSWKKELETHWGAVPEEVRKNVHNREQQILEGLQQYSEGHNAWRQVVAPFQQVLAQYPNENPVEIFQTLGQNHLMLLSAPKEQKVELARNLLAHYGLSPQDFGAPAGQPSANGQPSSGGNPQPFTPEQMAFLQQQLGPLSQNLQTAISHVQAQKFAENKKVVDAFFSNPENQFAGEVESDMLQLLQTGKAATLPEAYEMAVMRNPEVKAKYIAALAAKQKQPTQTTVPNVKSSTTPATPGKPRTMDETMAQVLEKHYGN